MHELDGDRRRQEKEPRQKSRGGTQASLEAGGIKEKGGQYVKPGVEIASVLDIPCFLFRGDGLGAEKRGPVHGHDPAVLDRMPMPVFRNLRSLFFEKEAHPEEFKPAAGINPIRDAPPRVHLVDPFTNGRFVGMEIQTPVAPLGGQRRCQDKENEAPEKSRSPSAPGPVGKQTPGGCCREVRGSGCFFSWRWCPTLEEMAENHCVHEMSKRPTSRQRKHGFPRGNGTVHRKPSPVYSNSIFL